MKKTILLALLPLFCLSCTNTSRTDADGSTILLSLTTDAKQDSAFLQPTDIRIVRLETTDSCLLGEIKQIDIVDHMVFVLDWNMKIYVFDNQGKFLHTIGQIGEGPQQYITCNFFYLDPKEKTIALYDNMRQRILCYDYTGKYRCDRIVSESGRTKWSSKGMATDEGKLLVYHGLNPGENYQYSLYGGEKTDFIWQKYPYAPLQPADHMYDFSKHPMARTAEGIDLIRPLCDTIYQYKAGTITPRYIVELPRPLMPATLFPKKLTYESSFIRNLFALNRDRRYHSGFTNLYETEGQLLLTTFSSSEYYIADKKAIKGSFAPLRHPRWQHYRYKTL